MIDAVERDVEVELTRRGHPSSRIVSIEPDVEDLGRWLDETTADSRDWGLLAANDRPRRDEDGSDDRRVGLA